jgi:hypothetical protein
MNRQSSSPPPLPNFIIVGAMKAGTSSLAASLRAHSDIFTPANEVHFFDVPRRYAKGLRKYRSYFTGWQGERAVGEKTPTYSYQAAAPERIASLLPEVKLIWIFRHPVARMVSHYWFFVSTGKERLSIDKALAREEAGRTTDYTMRYRDRSIYVKQVQRFQQFFSLDQMLFLLFEEYIQDPAGALARVCRFLEVDPEFEFPSRPARKNVTRIPRIQLLQWANYHLFRRRSTRIYRQLRRLNRRRTPGYPSLDPETGRELAAFFTPYNQQLATLTGLDIALWET